MPARQYPVLAQLLPFQALAFFLVTTAMLICG
jgi:hypothetical protein